MTSDGRQQPVCKCRRFHRPGVAGFTLVELLVALAVAAILLGVAAPQFGDFAAESQLTARYNELPKALRLARSEAIGRSAFVAVCARAGDEQCGSSWSNGWLVFVDGPGGNNAKLDSGETVLYRSVPAGSGRTVQASAVVGNDDGATPSGIRFGPRGRADWTLGTFTVCDQRGATHAKALVINGSGTFRQAYTSAASTDIVVDARGNAVTCP